jgi:hypothetical protein
MSPLLVTHAAARVHSHYPLVWQQRPRLWRAQHEARCGPPARALGMLVVHITLSIKGDAIIRVDATPASTRSMWRRKHTCQNFMPEALSIMPEALSKTTVVHRLDKTVLYTDCVVINVLSVPAQHPFRFGVQDEKDRQCGRSGHGAGSAKSSRG